jgi:hypothetical protein
VSCRDSDEQWQFIGHFGPQRGRGFQNQSHPILKASAVVIGAVIRQR